MKISDSCFTKIVKESSSIRQVLIKLKLSPAGGNYCTIKRRIDKLGLNTFHFTGQGFLKGKNHNWSNKIPLKEILVENSTYTNTYKLKRRLIKEGILEAKCSMCGITEWLGNPAPLELEHKNGNRQDNQIKNIELLCPNCHSLTPTYRGKKLRKS